MKFRQTNDGKRKIRASLDMTPLIDVVFQLILFFMLSSTFVVQNSIQIEMPKADGTQTLETNDMSLTLAFGEGGPDNSGMIYFGKENEEIYTWEQLTQRLSEEGAKRKEPVLTIRSDGRAQVERIVRVWGIATSVGITRFGIAAQPLDNEE